MTFPTAALISFVVPFAAAQTAPAGEPSEDPRPTPAPMADASRAVERPAADPVPTSAEDGLDPFVAAAIAIIGGTEDAASKVQALLVATPDDGALRALDGLRALAVGDRLTARRQLPATPAYAVYRAMAEAGRAGGAGRAREILAVALRERDPPPGAMFLAGLAFEGAGQRDRAQALLQRALRASKSTLDEAFAPDPLVAVARLAVASASSNAQSGVRIAVATALVVAGGRGAARRLIADDDGAAAAYVRWASWDGVDPRRAVAAARRAAPAKEELALIVAESTFARGRSPQIPDGPLDTDAWEARRDRLRAAVALKADRAADALDAARSAARRAPDNDEGRVLLIDALVASGDVARARSFAETLLAGRSTRVNPYRSLLAATKDAPERRRKLTTLRSLAWERQQAKLRSVARRRERVLAAARDADGGLGATGLDALRVNEPTLALAVDLAIAKHGSAGAARAARDRVVARCAPHLMTWLGRGGDWSHTTVRISPYGDPVDVRVDLSDPDPGRCPGGPVRAVGRRF